MSMTDAEIFASYLRRLGVTAPASPSLAALTELMGRHLLTVPFENLDVMAKSPRALSTAGVLTKVAVDARGGFCYELNEAFRALLDHLGFIVHRIEARVWQAPSQRFGAPFDHLALVARLPDGEYLVDVGFGDGNRVPLRLPEDQAEDISGVHRLAPARDGYLLLSSPSQPLYEMTLTDQPLDAFEPRCRFHQTSSESIFSQGLICTRATATGRITLSRTRLIVVEHGRRTESLTSDVGAALREHFSIENPGAVDVV
jgi:N-hydroxyarylamine O-acetyltransferase